MFYSMKQSIARVLDGHMYNVHVLESHEELCVGATVCFLEEKL
jgi:hypothetical protein